MVTALTDFGLLCRPWIQVRVPVSERCGFESCRAEISSRSIWTGIGRSLSIPKTRRSSGNAHRPLMRSNSNQKLKEVIVFFTFKTFFRQFCFNNMWKALWKSAQFNYFIFQFIEVLNLRLLRPTKQIKLSLLTHVVLLKYRFPPLFALVRLQNTWIPRIAKPSVLYNPGITGWFHKSCIWIFKTLNGGLGL